MRDRVIDPSILAPDRVRPLRREEYDRLVAAGCFEDEKIELLEGLLVAMSPQGTAHAYAVGQLTMLLAPALVGRAIIRPQCSFAASDDSEPEPDLAVVPKANYRHEHPAGALLLIEVAESSLRKDRLIKAGIYARAGVPEYWIVDLKAGCIEVYRAPHQGVYSQITAHRRGETVRPEAFPDVEVPVAEIVGGD
jgi:Uma2 family endonuclease